MNRDELRLFFELDQLMIEAKQHPWVIFSIIEKNDQIKFKLNTVHSNSNLCLLIQKFSKLNKLTYELFNCRSDRVFQFIIKIDSKQKEIIDWLFENALEVIWKEKKANE